MKTIPQYKLAEWLGVKPPTLSNIFCNNRRPGRKEARRLAEVSGVAFEKWMLSDGNQLREELFSAWEAMQAAEKGCRPGQVGRAAS